MEQVNIIYELNSPDINPSMDIAQKQTEGWLVVSMATYQDKTQGWHLIVVFGKEFKQ